MTSVIQPWEDQLHGTVAESISLVPGSTTYKNGFPVILKHQQPPPLILYYYKSQLLFAFSEVNATMKICGC